jgi:hypothetical protein
MDKNRFMLIRIGDGPTPQVCHLGSFNCWTGLRQQAASVALQLKKAYPMFRYIVVEMVSEALPNPSPEYTMQEVN